MSATGRHAAGFTLLELLVVLAIIAIATAAAAGFLAPRPEGAMVRAARDTLIADLRRQRMSAIATGHAHGVATYEDGSGYRLLPQGKGIRLPDTMKVAQRSASGITFYPDGSSSGGMLRLRANAVDLGLKVEPLLGRVAMVEGS